MRVTKKFIENERVLIIRVGDFYMLDKYALLPTSEWYVPEVYKEVNDEYIGEAARSALSAKPVAEFSVETSYFKSNEFWLEFSFRPDEPDKVCIIGLDGIIDIIPAKHNIAEPYAAAIAKEFILGLYPRHKKLKLWLIPWGRNELDFIWRIIPGHVIYAPVRGDKLVMINGWPTTIHKTKN